MEKERLERTLWCQARTGHKLLELMGFNMSKQTEIYQFPSHTFSGVGISRANTALSGPYCDIWGGRVHC